MSENLNDKIHSFVGTLFSYKELNPKPDFKKHILYQVTFYDILNTFYIITDGHEKEIVE